MIVHYQNGNGEEKMLEHIIALQNINDEEWEAVTETNRILRLFTSRIEMVLDNKMVRKENEK